jgi:autotransporter-associated beta strand protein
MKRIRSLPAVACSVLLAGLGFCLPETAPAQTTWTGLTGGEWGTAANWNNGVPNATDAVANINTALTVNVSDTGTAGTYPYTFGTLNFGLASGSVILGNAGFTTDQLTAAVTTGTPVLSVANGSATVYFYASLLGTQGFNKTGSGKLTFRYNGADQNYTGNITISGGVLGINQDGSLGDVNNDIVIANGARLLAEPGTATGTITLPATRAITLTGAQSQIGVGAAPVNLIIQGPVGESPAGQGLAKTDAGTVTLAGTVSYTGDTRIAGGTLALSGPALLPAGANLRFNASAAALDVGGTTQTVRTIVMDLTTANRTFTGGGALVVNGDANLQLSASNNVTYDFSGLGAFTFNRANRQLNFQNVNAASVTSLNDFKLAAAGSNGGANTFTAAQVLVGAGDSNGNNGNASRLHLGTHNTFNAPLCQIGGYNAGGVVNFQAGLTNPVLTLRGADGVSPMGTLKVGETSSGLRNGAGTLDLTGGSLDALVTNIFIGHYLAGASLSESSSLIMPAGSLTADTLMLAEKTNTGAPVITATFTQGGGTVKIRSLVMGQDDGSGATARLLPAYNLNGGTFFAATIGTGGGTFAANSARTLNLNGGVLRNYDAATDLTVNGLDATAAGQVQVILGGGAQSVNADAGRTITFAANTAVSGAGSLVKDGAGMLVLAGANSFTGDTEILAGTLALSGAATLTNSPNLRLGAGATLDVSAMTTPLALVAGQTLAGTGAGCALAGSVDLGAGALALTYTNGQPTLNVSAGNLQLNGNAVAVTVSGATPLPGGSYKLVAAGAGGAVTGTLPGSVTVNGAGVAAGANASLQLTGGELYLVVNHAPVAGPVSFSRNGLTTWKISVADLLTNATDADGNPLTLVSVGTSTNGITPVVSSGWVQYASTNLADDAFVYTVADSFGATGSAVVTLMAGSAAGVGGQVTGFVLNNGAASMSFAGIPGYKYDVQVSTNLTDWTTLWTTNAPAGGVFEFNDPAAPQPNAYYRLRWNGN